MANLKLCQSCNKYKVTASYYKIADNVCIKCEMDKSRSKQLELPNVDEIIEKNYWVSRCRLLNTIPYVINWLETKELDIIKRFYEVVKVNKPRTKRANLLRQFYYEKSFKNNSSF
jgi:hypothetical protein